MREEEKTLTRMGILFFLGLFTSIILPKKVVFLSPLLVSILPESKFGAGVSGYVCVP